MGVTAWSAHAVTVFKNKKVGGWCEQGATGHKPVRWCCRRNWALLPHPEHSTLTASGTWGLVCTHGFLGYHLGSVNVVQHRPWGFLAGHLRKSGCNSLGHLHMVTKLATWGNYIRSFWCPCRVPQDGQLRQLHSLPHLHFSWPTLWSSWKFQHQRPCFQRVRSLASGCHAPRCPAPLGRASGPVANEYNPPIPPLWPTRSTGPDLLLSMGWKHHPDRHIDSRGAAALWVPQ
jgi:hypothetical protein